MFFYHMLTMRCKGFNRRGLYGQLSRNEICEYFGMKVKDISSAILSIYGGGYVESMVLGVLCYITYISTGLLWKSEDELVLRWKIQKLE